MNGNAFFFKLHNSFGKESKRHMPAEATNLCPLPHFQLLTQCWRTKAEQLLKDHCWEATREILVSDLRIIAQYDFLLATKYLTLMLNSSVIFCPDKVSTWISYPNRIDHHSPCVRGHLGYLELTKQTPFYNNLRKYSQEGKQSKALHFKLTQPLKMCGDGDRGWGHCPDRSPVCRPLRIS